MKQDDFEAAVRKYTEELMRYNAKRAKTEPASKPPAAEKTMSEEKPAVNVQPKPAEEKAVMAEPAEKQEIVFTPSVESVVEEQEEETEEQQREEQQESIITERPDPTEEQLEEFAAEQSQQTEEQPEETAPEQPEAVEESPEETTQSSRTATENQLPPTADEFAEQNTEDETEPAEEESAEENLPQPEADEDFEEIAPEEFIDIPEEKKLEQRYKGRGVLKVTAITADGTMPLENVVIKISYESENGDELYAVARTGISGQIEPVTLPAPVSDQNAKDVLFAPYTITAQLIGYTGVSITNVPIFDGQITSQTFNLAPLPLGTESGNMDIVSEEPKF